MNNIKDTIREDIYLCKFVADRIIENNMSKEIQEYYSDEWSGSNYVEIESKELCIDVPWIRVNYNGVYIFIHENEHCKYDSSIMEYHLDFDSNYGSELIKATDFQEFIRAFEELNENKLYKAII